MENYSKGKNEEEPWNLSNVPIKEISEDITWMKVSPGSKMVNLLEFALNIFKDKDDILWSGSGPAIGKTISCAEIMKKKFKNIHQISAICYRKVEEFWDPRIDALDQLKVTREIPTIHILLSKQPLDSTIPGYQAPDNQDVFWKSNNSNSRKNYPNKGRSTYQRRNYADDLGLIKNKKNRRAQEPKNITEMKDRT